MIRLKSIMLVSAVVITLLGIALTFRFVGARAVLAQAKSSLPKARRYVAFREIGGPPADLGSVEAVLGFDVTRSDGATVHGRYQKRPDGQTYLQRRILFPDSGKEILVLDEVKSVSTTYLPDNHPRRFGLLTPDPEKQCMEGKSPAIRTPKGILKEQGLYQQIPVFVVQDTIQNMTITEWRAPSLDCYALRSEMERWDTKTGQIAARFERIATVINTDEPNPGLFEIPDWQERSPIGTEEEYFRRFKGGVIDPNLYWTHAKQEKIYNERHH
jgi:hypothetical protein